MSSIEVYENIFDESIRHEDAITAFRNLLSPEISMSMSDPDILRFLRARGGSLSRAMEMVLAWDTWRHTIMRPMYPRSLTYSPNTIWSMPWADHIFHHPHLDLLPVALHGFTKEGHPIYWERTGLIQSTFHEVKKYFEIDQLLQYHIQTQESTEVRLAYASKKFGKEITKSVNVLDMKHLTMSIDFQAIAYMKAMLSMDQNNYPERLHQLIVINAPRFFSFVFAIFKPFIDKRTLDKFLILGYDYMSTLEAIIDKSTIPVEMGGGCADVPWGGPFKEESGADEEAFLSYFRGKYTEEMIPQLLRADEQECLNICLAAAQADIESGASNASPTTAPTSPPRLTAGTTTANPVADDGTTVAEKASALVETSVTSESN